jgi:NDP-sugar pyrophosphorylase family protein
MHIIIPMSGIGKRFIDAGYNTPKPLIIIEGKPIIQHVVELFSGENKFTFICNEWHIKTTNMKEILKKICPTGSIISVDSENRKGPVHAVLQIPLDLIENDEEVIISYCDFGTKWNYGAFKKSIKGFDGCIPCYRGFHPHMLGSDNYAFVNTNEEDGRVLKIQEKKPFTNHKMNEYASNGIYYFKKGEFVKKYFQKLMDLNIEVNGEFYVSMVYNLMIEDNLYISVFEIEKMLQWGTPKDLKEYLFWSDYFLHRDINFNKKDFDTLNTTLILPMAGAGSRFFNVGYEIPKPLLNIEGKPMVISAVECLPAFSNVIFVCQKTHLDNYPIYDEIKTFPNAKVMRIDFITEGQACTCELAIDESVNMEQPLMISACDNGVYYDIIKYKKMLINDDIDIIVWSFSDNISSKLYPQMYAWLDVDENGIIRRVSIKKPFDDIENKYAIIGTILFKKAKYFKKGLEEIYKNKIRTNGEYYVDNMIEPLILLGYKCHIFNVDNYLCWGTPNDYKTYNYWSDYFQSL